MSRKAHRKKGLKKIVDKVNLREGEVGENRVIGIVSGKGGVGKTTFVANVGIAITELDQDIIVVDADLTTSNLGLQLDLYHFPVGLQDALRGEVKIQEAIYVHPSGLKAVPASISMKYLNTPYSPYRLKNLLKGFGGYVLIDSPPGLEKGVYSVIKACDEVIVITNPEIPAVTDALKVVKLARDLKKEPIGIVLNRVKKSYELRPEEIEEMCEVSVIGEIPEDKMVKRSLFEKTPLVKFRPYSQASIAFRKVAADLIGVEYKKPRFLRLKRLIGRSK